MAMVAWAWANAIRPPGALSCWSGTLARVCSAAVRKAVMGVRDGLSLLLICAIIPAARRGRFRYRASDG